MNRLKDLREENDLLQKDVARILNMHQAAYSKYECETRIISIEALKKLADFYGTSVDYLIYQTDKREPYPKSIMKEKK